jgi:hypothetical protein
MSDYTLKPSSTYNGWTNKETWLVNLWIGDSLTMDQEAGCEITAAYIEQVVDEMASALRDGPDRGSTAFMADLLNCALCEIDYDELASHYEEDE